MSVRGSLAATVRAVTILGAIGGFAACASSGSEGSSYEAPNVDSRVPHGSLDDWVTYGDYVVVGTVLSEAEEGERQEHGDGTVTVGRSVTVRVERTLWAAPGFEPLETVEVSDWGWTIEHGRRKGSRDQMKVGERYMLPLARFDRGWGYIGLRGYEVEGDRLTEELSKGSSWLRQLGGMSVDELAAALARAQPDPRAATLRDLPAHERAEAVFGEGAVFP